MTRSPVGDWNRMLSEQHIEVQGAFELAVNTLSAGCSNGSVEPQLERLRAATVLALVGGDVAEACRLLDEVIKS